MLETVKSIVPHETSRRRGARSPGTLHFSLLARDGAAALPQTPSDRRATGALADRPENDAGQSAFDALTIGIIRVDRDARILYANPEAERLLGRGAGLIRVSHALLCAQDISEGRRLRAVIARACEGRGGAVAISRLADGKPLFVIAVPGLAAPRARAESVLIISDPEHRAPALTERLRDLFGLTPAEAEVAVAVGRGQDLAEISAARRVKVSTLRDQISSVFAKTDTTRQAQLAGLIGRLAALG